MSEASEFTDYYDVLGVSANANTEQIRSAFLKLARQHHPDVGGSTEIMQQITKAYRTLMSVSRRKAYDLLYDFHTGNTTSQYRDYGESASASVDDPDDRAVDDFLDTIYAEYSAKAKSPEKLSWRDRLKRLFD